MNDLIECSEIVFITDIHLANSSNVRVDEDYTETILKKVSYCIDFANKHNALLLIGGDFLINLLYQ